MDNVSVVQSMYDALASGDIPSFVQGMDPGIEWFEAEHHPYWTGQPFVGPQAVLDRVFARIPQDIDDFRIEVRRLVDGGDTVVAEVRYHGTGVATGTQLDIQVAHVWDLRNRKVVRWQQYMDTWAFRQAVGRTPDE